MQILMMLTMVHDWNYLWDVCNKNMIFTKTVFYNVLGLLV